MSKQFYGNIFVDFPPSAVLKPYIASYWFLHNSTGSTIYLPVVPDGCCDIIFPLDSDDPPFIVGLMTCTRIIPTPPDLNLFGIRFQPAVLSFLLGKEMRQLTDTTELLSRVNGEVALKLKVSGNVKEEIIESINGICEKMVRRTSFHPLLLQVVQELIDAPDGSISDLAKKSGLNIKSLERLFYRHVGVAPKKFAGIARFFKAHKNMLHGGLQDLVNTSLVSGYFDQAHFNREFKKLTGTHPTSETMSILYKNRLG